MKITASDFNVIEKLHPKQRGNVSISNLQVLSAILYVAEHGCKWRGLPKRYGNWHTIYKHANRWAKRDVPGHVFAALQEWDWRFKKTVHNLLGKSPAGWTTKTHMVAAEAKTAVTFALSHGQAGDPPEGCCRKHLKMTGGSGRMSLWTKPTKGDETRQLILALEMLPVVPPKSNRLTPWGYDKEMYKKRSELERVFHRLKGFRPIFSRFDKLDVVFMFFIHFALITDAIFGVNTPW